MKPHLPLLLGLLALNAGAADFTAQQVEFFEKEIRPILVEHCYECHDGAKTKGGLRLDFAGGWKAGGDSGTVIAPGNAKESLLWRSVAGLEEDLEMPKGADPLPQKAVEALAKWIDLGAPDPREHPPAAAETQAMAWETKLAKRRTWWSLQPPAPAATEAPLTEAVDALLHEKRTAAGLTSAPATDPVTLLRRLSYILTGRPPSEADILALEKAPADWDYAAHVDRLLASEAFGERWARLWMDMVRYADTQGDQANDLTRESWAYRDYLVRAFNADLPLDTLIREHIAGDLIDPPRRRDNGDNESLLGATFYRFTEIGSIGEDPQQEEIALIDNQIDALGKAFQGLTISCARCHDHKFDAISTADYYALYGILQNTRQRRHVVTSPEAWRDEAVKLATLKKEIRSALAKHWRAEIAALQALPPIPVPELTVPTGEPLSLDDWFADGPAFGGEKAAPAPAWSLAPDGEELVRGIYGPGFYSDRVSERLPGIVQSPDFRPAHRYVSLRLVGGNVSAARVIVENYQTFQAGGNGPFAWATPYLDSSRPQWITLDLERWQGLQTYLEVAGFDFLTHPRTNELNRDGGIVNPSPKADYERFTKDLTAGSWFGIQDVVFHDEAPERDSNPRRRSSAWRRPAEIVDADTAKATARPADLLAAIDAWETDTITHDDAALLHAAIDQGVLPNQLDRLPDDLHSRVTAWREGNRSLPHLRYASAVAHTGNRPGVPVFARGAYQSAEGDPVPAGYLGVFDPGGFEEGSPYRMQLATQITSRENPLTARVIANRLWQAVFGSGLVSTLDNFGILGETPSHPELLDHLAVSLRDDDWSAKRFLRALVLTEAFRRSSIPQAESLAADPANRLLHHYPVRRLEAEWLLDSLRLAGTDGFASLTERAVYQPQLSRHLRVTGNWRDGRVIRDPWKSPALYSVVDRAQLDLRDLFGLSRRSMVGGARDAANLPEQGLAQLNGADFSRAARELGERAARSESPEDAIGVLARRTLGRSPNADELRASLDWLGPQPATGSWTELAHVYLLRRDFLFLQ